MSPGAWMPKTWPMTMNANGSLKVIQCFDAVAERAAHQRRVLAEPPGDVAAAPAAAILQRLRQIPVVERDERA